MPLNLFLPVISKVVDSVTGLIPDKRARAEAKEQLEHELVTTANTALLAQLEINKTEAAHRSWWVAGWRPFLGWTCGLGVFWAFLGHPLAVWVMTLAGIDVALPEIDSERLLELVTAMLGLAGLRTFEKTRGVARER